MTDSELEKLHRVLLYITSEIDRVCKENNISYVLAGGSVIGAVRHKGFIPWDDDVDVAMYRAEYEKFIDACGSCLGDQFELQTLENDPNYSYGFAKLYLKGTKAVSEGHEEEKWQRGIYVDIFPFDDIPDDVSLRNKQRKRNYFLIKLLEAKNEKPWKNTSFAKKILFLGLRCISIFCSQESLTSKLNANMKKYNGCGGKEISMMSGYYGYDIERFDRSIFDNISYMPFENCSFPVFDDYDTYLSRLYGDYMQLPPPEKRHTHDFAVLDFGDFKF